MNAEPLEAQKGRGPSAGAVLLWCALAGMLVGVFLLVDPPQKRGFEWWSPIGTLRLLADLMLFYSIFLLPAFPRATRNRLGGRLLVAGIVTLTGVLGLLTLNDLVGVRTGLICRFVALVVLVSGGSVLWGFVLANRPAIYYPVAALAGFGLPTVRFFCDELFRIEARWLDVFCPFMAWRVILDDGAGAWACWVVFGVVFVSGAATALLTKWRKST